jgi:hypothetical protein
MNNNSKVSTPKTAKECEERVKQLMSDPNVRAHCESLDKQGVQYKVIPLNHSIMS